MNAFNEIESATLLDCLVIDQFNQRTNFEIIDAYGVIPDDITYEGLDDLVYCLQQKAGYTPQGYGWPTRIDIRQGSTPDGVICWILTWECWSSCD